MKAMIFAAGLGTRLRPLTKHTPKPLIRVRQRPLLDWIVLQLKENGITSIIMNTHHLHERIVEHLEKSDYGIPVELSYEKKILGTGGGLLKTKPYWDTEDFYLCNADILCTAALREFFAFHCQTGNLATLGINDRVSNSMLLIDADGMLVGILRKGTRKILRKPAGDVRAVGFCGFQTLSPRIFSYFAKPVAFSIIDEYLKLVEKGIGVSTWSIGNAYWEDVGTPETLEKADREFPGFSYSPSY